MFRPTLHRTVAPLLVIAVVAGLAACGGSDDGDSAEIQLTEAGQRGQEVSRSNGCASCHGTDGQGGVGPAWVGLYGARVDLADGTSVVADDTYLARAITDPGADIVADTHIQMPKNSLDDDQIADVIAYIRDLSGVAPPDEAGPDEEGADEEGAASGFTGIVREPAPEVGDLSLPSLDEPGTDLAFQAGSGGLQVVFFGYTHCPDVCPTTLADLTVALRKLPPADAASVEPVMVTIDPDRDLPVLTEYVQSFLPDGRAAGTTDAAQLQTVADRFGVTYAVTTGADGDVEVVHSGFVYVVDDQGRLVLTWPFGTTSDDMASDLALLLAGEVPTAPDS